MKSIIASLLIAATTFSVMQPVRAAADDSSAGFTPVICVTDGCTTDGGTGKPRR